LKLFYKIHPTKYEQAIKEIQEEFDLVKQVDEAKTMLMPEQEEGPIELVSGMFDPREDDMASIRVVLLDKSLRDSFDSILGEPYRVK